jgi:hypothetical protein
MPHPHVLPRPRWTTLAARLLLTAGVIAGLLGMHVMMSPTAHAAHSATPVAMTESPATSHDEGAAAHSPADPSAVACALSACADALPNSHADIWAFVCVLALLLTALLAVRSAVFWRALRPRSDATAAVRPVAGDSGPQHPPSLIVLSISRT